MGTLTPYDWTENDRLTSKSGRYQELSERTMVDRTYKHTRVCPHKRTHTMRNTWLRSILSQTRDGVPGLRKVINVCLITTTWTIMKVWVPFCLLTSVRTYVNPSGLVCTKESPLKSRLFGFYEKVLIGQNTYVQGSVRPQPTVVTLFTD